MHVAPLILSGLTVLVTSIACPPVQARTLSVSVSEGLVSADLYVMPGEPITLMFDGMVEDTRVPHNDFLRRVANPEPDPNQDPERKRTMLTLDVARDARNSWKVTFQAEDYIAHVIFRVSRDRTRVFDGADFRYARDEQLIAELTQTLATQRERHEREKEELIATNQLLTESKQALEQEVAELSTASRDVKENVLLWAFSHRRNATPLGKESCQEQDIDICGVSWERIDDHGILLVAIHGSTVEGTFRTLQVKDSQGIDRAVKVSVAQGQPVAPDEMDLRVQHHTSVQVAILVSNVNSFGDYATVALGGPDIKLAKQLYISGQGPPAGRGRITIRLQPSIGAMWLPNPVNKDELGAAMLVGLGVRGSYAFWKTFAIEAELAGIRSNDARFIDATMGEIHRSASGARFLLGGAVRLGETYQPYARLGVGAQAVNHDVRIMAGQNPTTGPGDGFAFSALGWFGAGLDIQLGSNWTAGGGVSVVVQTGGNPSLEGGIQLGYGWGGHPEPEPW